LKTISNKCSNCGAEISAGISKCPYCGKSFSSWFKRHPVLTVLIILFFAPSILGILGGIIGSSSNSSKSENVVGKYAYNKTNGVYIGVVADTKDCATAPSIRCYKINYGEGYSKNSEHPVDNVDVKNTPPSLLNDSSDTPEDVNEIDIAGKLVKVGDFADNVFAIVTDEYKVDTPTIEPGKVTHHLLIDETLFDMTFERNSAGSYYILTRIVVKDRDIRKLPLLISRQLSI